ncbi:alpha/beta fold hydrolase [Aureimonas leprariae]|uniref:Alpha/beta fold hydrolase n=2 Tax=Plantimonas leprariae TaxID=2615207 RepID=A0A7V7TV32_9HYPH|nr:alpha/beta fold hydrolase [Aureimonas leprariae]
MLPVAGGRHKVWTKRVGEGKTKVLLLHGGPGFSHDYLEVMESFLPPAGIELYHYDQLGCGNSDRPDDAALWTLPRYLDEVEEVRQGLGLDRFVLYGHSWGGILGIEYALRHPDRLSGLVISNMTASIASFLQRLETLKDLLPPASRARLAELEKAEDYDSPDYHRIVEGELYPQVLCRTQPWPEPLTRAFRIVNPAIYGQMQGKSEFVVTGNLRGWDSWDRLARIRTPTLTIGAEHDEMDPADLVRMAELMPNARSAICPNGSHLPMYDDQAVFFDHLLGFLKSV